MTGFEVSTPILNSPYEEPAEYWDIEEGKQAERRSGRRPAGYFYRDPRAKDSDDEHEARGQWIELALVNQLRKQVKSWREHNPPYPGVSRTTLELLSYWRRDGRRQRLFLPS